MAGDLSDRNLTLGAPDAIKDMLYGDSYVPYIKRAYKGSTLIFDREPDNWLYHIENVDCNKTYTVDNYKDLQPEYIYYIHENIQPFLYENHKRDWEFLINIEDTREIGDSSTIPLITYLDVYEDTTDVKLNNIGGPNVELYLLVEINKSTKNDRIRIAGSSQFTPYSSSDKFDSWITYNKSTYGSIIGKDIHVVKQLEYENDSWVNKVYFYISGLLITTLTYTDVCTSKARVGSIMRAKQGGYFFKGIFKYFKFRYNNDLRPNTFTMESAGDIPKLQSYDFSETTVVENEKFTKTTEVTTPSYGTAYVTQTVTDTDYKDPTKKDRSTHLVSGISAGLATGTGFVSSWQPYYDKLVSPTVDGFGVRVKPVDLEDDPHIFYQAFFDDDTATELVTRSATIISRESESHYPYILDGGGWSSSGSNNGGKICVIYKKSDGSYIPESRNYIFVMGKSAKSVITPNEWTTAIYFNNIKQLIAFNQDGKELSISDVYTPTVFDPAHDGGLSIFGYKDSNGNYKCTTYADEQTEMELFTIKYNTDDEDNENA